MKLEFFNCPAPEKISPPAEPNFLSYRPDFSTLASAASEFSFCRNILVVAHGGSLTSFLGFYEALKHQAKKQVYFLSTVDPDYIFDLKSKLKREDTLVLAISKSGETVTQLEMLMQFSDYPMAAVTGRSSTLRAVAEKLGARVFMHPSIGGRYTGLTEVGLLPAALAGLDFQDLYQGAAGVYQNFFRDNLAWRAASIFWQLEQSGYLDIFVPVYSHGLFPFSGLIVQLCHESFGKAGLGQTYFAHEAPESQHHTNQRFFGGRKNIAGFFLSSASFVHGLANTFPPTVHSLQIKGRAFFDLNKITLSQAMQCELLGTLDDARINGIPAAHLEISGFSAREIGALAAFWQLFAVYSSILRGVDPYDQPQVENSKRISMARRLNLKGLS